MNPPASLSKAPALVQLALVSSTPGNATGPGRSSVSAAPVVLFASQPCIDLPISFVACHSVALLNATCELVAPTRHLVEIVVGELTPLLSDLALELFPVPFDLIPIHGRSPWLIQTKTGRFDTRFREATRKPPPRPAG